MTASRWIPVAVWIGVILTGTSAPTVPGPDVPGLDKVGHFAMYAVLGILTARAVRGGVATPRPLLVVLAAIAVFGAADELHQRLIPGRSADVADWFADVTGATVGVGTYAAFKFRRIKGT
jgi:VanZ family protein